MTRYSRASASWARPLVILLLVVQAMAAPALTGAGQESAAPAEIGAPPILEQAWSFVGQSQLESGQVAIAGRLTAVSGLDLTVLQVAAGNESGAGSRFTFVIELLNSDAASRGNNVVTTTGSGLLTVYLHDGTPLNDNGLTSFRAGIAVAEFAAEFQNTDIADSADVGVVAGTMTLTQTESLTFSLDETPYRFGHAGLELALRYVGGLVAGEGGAGSGARVFGAAIVSGRAANPTDTGAASAGLSECEQLLAWIDATRSRLAIANEIRSDIGAGGEISPDGLVQVGTSFAGLVEEQRNHTAPADAGGAERLALAALSTDARGVELLAAAIEAGDESAVTQAMAILADGAALAGRALLALDEAAPVCDPPS